MRKEPYYEIWDDIEKSKSVHLIPRSRRPPGMNVLDVTDRNLQRADDINSCTEQH